MKIPKNGSSIRQTMYARRAWGAKQQQKKLIALDVGYSPNAAMSVKSKIESRPGYHNAMAKLAQESNNVAFQVLSELQARGFTDYTNKDLVAALNAISGAWDRFNKGVLGRNVIEDNGKNRLKTVILQNINKQVINPPKEQLPQETIIETTAVEEDPGF